jgi:hypothetical protein
MTKNVYHIGIGKRNKTMVIQAVKCVDYLDCEIYDYMGKRETTKQSIKNKRYELLKLMQNKRPDVYGNLRFAVVE